MLMAIVEVSAGLLGIFWLVKVLSYWDGGSFLDEAISFATADTFILLMLFLFSPLIVVYMIYSLFRKESK